MNPFFLISIVNRLITVSFVVLTLLTASLAAQDRREEEQDHFKRWLEQDVVYIISAAEKAVFQKLTTEDEKVVFIEQFWKSRDPNPNLPGNEFRDEHYRRIAYANDNFDDGKAGWKTDRGMIYIKFGPPDRRETRPMGGRVFRTTQELLASDSANPSPEMTAFPFEIWEYRSLPGLGNEVQFEFVAKEGGTDYRLALSPDEKDALYFNTGSHIPKMRERTRGLKTFRASQLDRLEALANAQRPLPTRPSEGFVSAQVHFDEMPFTMETAVEGDGESSGCELQLLIPHSSLTFERRLEEYFARVQMEVFVRDVRKIVVGHREEQLETKFGSAELRSALRESSLYETRFALPPGRYLVEVWIKDILGDSASFDRRLVIIPRETSKNTGSNSND